MTETAQAQALALLRGAELPQAWAGQDIWRILDTRFDVLRFLLTWQIWHGDTQRPRLLHVVALTRQPPDAQALQKAATPYPGLAPLAQELAAQCFGLLPGFHRITLQRGQVLLTLCVGEPHALLREQQFAADSIFLDSPSAPDTWDRWSLKALARCCRRGTGVSCTQAPAELLEGLAQCGFDMQASRGQFNPRWELKATREPLRTRAATPGTCAVIGAGLAGASVASSLARRGWQVTVFDAAPTPAAGASGLPAGLLVPHVSADDSPRSRLSRAGVRLTLQQAHSLLQQGQDWDAAGVLEHRVDGTAGLPADWSEAGRDWSCAAPPEFKDAPWAAGMVPGVPTLWHAKAAWIKPAQLVRAWLAQPGVQFRGNARVCGLKRHGEQWQLLGQTGQTLCESSHVVLANASGALPLLDSLGADLPARAQLPAMRDMRGVVSSGLRQPGDTEALPPFPVNGLGSLIPRVPTESGPTWYAGATYEPADQLGMSAADHHDGNLEKLRVLLPAAARALAPAFEPVAAQGWGGTRCVSADRMPVVGALLEGATPSLWISAAMGSRGLSFSVLCAELLAARLGAEPLPVEASLARFLRALRADD